MAVQQLVHGSQGSAARAEQTRRFVEHASWVKAKLRRVEQVEYGCAGEQQREGQDNPKDRSALRFSVARRNAAADLLGCGGFG